MITNIKIDAVEAKRESDSEIKGLDINISIEGVVVDGAEVEVSFSYTATYKENVGYLKMKGKLRSREDNDVAGKIKKSWDNDKKLPTGYSELVLNAVNFTCGTNGVLVVRPVNLAPPMVPPRIQVTGEPPKAGDEKIAPSGRMD